MSGKKTVKERMVTVKLAKIPGESNHTTISVNGRVYQMQRGVSIKVPESVAEIIVNSEKARADAENYIETKIYDDKK